MNFYQIEINGLSEEISYPLPQVLKVGANIKGYEALDFLMFLRFIDNANFYFDKKTFINFTIKSEFFVETFDLTLGDRIFCFQSKDKNGLYNELNQKGLGTTLASCLINKGNEKLIERSLNEDESFIKNIVDTTHFSYLTKWNNLSLVDVDYSNLSYKKERFGISQSQFDFKVITIAGCLSDFKATCIMKDNLKALFTIPCEFYQRGVMLYSLEKKFGVSSEIGEHIKVFPTIEDFFKGYKCGLSSLYKGRGL